MASSNPGTEINGALQAKLNDDEAAASAKNGGATSVITLAGENEGAAMEASGVEELVIVEADDGDGEEEEEEEEEEGIVCAYTNSNYQAVNNSMVVAGSCAIKDPGVHVVIVEHVDEIRDEEDNQDGVKEAKRG